MKKKTIIILSIVAIFLIVAGVFGYKVWYDYINPVITATKYTKEELKEATDDKKLIEDITGLKIRDFTEEEKAAVEKGEKKESEVMENILKEAIKEKQTELLNVDAGAKEPDDKKSGNKSGKSASENNKTADAANTKTDEKSKGNNGKDSGKDNDKTNEKSYTDSSIIIAKYLGELYALSGTYSGVIEGMIPEIRAYYYNLRQVHRYSKEAAISATSKAYYGRISGAEAECDAKVAGVISRMESELRANGHSTEIASTVKSRYEGEKASKRAYYVKLLMGN